MKKKLLVLILVCAFSLSLFSNVGSAAVPDGMFDYSPIGAPLGDGSMKFELTVTVNGKLVKKTVEVTGIKKWVPPVKMPGDTVTDFNKKIHDAKAAASVEKSKVIAAAVNKAFENEFKIIGAKAETGNRVVETFVAPFVKYGAPFGAVVVPGITREQGNPFVFKENKILGEGGNGGTFIPGVTPSKGTKMSMGRLDLAVPSILTGLDPFDEPSFVEIGIEDLYVARFDPIGGMSDDALFMELEKLLDENGIDATYDSSLFTLFLDNPYPDGTRFVWGSTDSGLDYFVSLESLGLIPEPGTLGLLMMGLMSGAWIKRRPVRLKSRT